MTKKFTLSEEDKRLFAEAIAGSKPLAAKKHRKALENPQDAQSQAYRRYQASKTSLHAEPASLVSAETPLLFRRDRDTVSDKQLHALQQGVFPKPIILDLHGLSEDEAIAELNHFIYQSQKKKNSVVLIVHGKGNRSTLNAPILKNAVNTHLRQLDAVLAFCSARAEDGGNGAVYVLLK